MNLLRRSVLRGGVAALVGTVATSGTAVPDLLSQEMRAAVIGTAQTPSYGTPTVPAESIFGPQDAYRQAAMNHFVPLVMARLKHPSPKNCS